MSGQYFTALSLLYLAHLTQRVAIMCVLAVSQSSRTLATAFWLKKLGVSPGLTSNHDRSPSFRDWDHYGDSMITLDLLFDMEKFRQERGALFVYWDEVKPLDRQHKRTQRDAIGCYMGNNAFEGGRSFDEHNLDQTIWRVARPGGGNLQHSVESFVLFDVDEKDRLARLHKFADAEKREIPENMLGSQVLCYSNLWDLSHAHALADGWQWHEGFRGQQRGDGELKDLLGISARGTHPGASTASLDVWLDG